MAKLLTLTNHLDTLLNTHDIPDTFWNGLQVEGSQEVTRITLAVDACLETIQATIAYEAHMLITHHGIFTTKSNPALVDWQKDRIQLLLDNNISLYVAHLPLDKHKELGNNALLLALLGAKITESFAQNISWIGEIKPTSLDTIVKKLEKELATQCVVLPMGKEKIKRIAVCTGGGGYRTFMQAVDAHVDLYISGDTVDIARTAQDARMNVIFAGHYATEILGVQALGEYLAEKYALEALFLDAPTNL